MTTPYTNPEVERVFAGFPPQPRGALLELRELIFAKAARTPGVGDVTETLKWGEPAYLTASTRSGSTIRIGWKPGQPDRYAMYFHCQTNLVETFRMMFPDDFLFEGNRAIVFELGAPVPMDSLAECVAAALTYHLRKRAGSRSTAQRVAT